MPSRTFANLCDELAAMGTSSMTISGEGEPFLHPHIVELIANAKATGHTVTVFTNGTALGEDTLRSLIDARLDRLRVSLWAGSHDEYASAYPGTDPRLFDKVVATLGLLSRLKLDCRSRYPQLELHHPIDRGNHRHIEAIADLASNTGCDRLSFSPFKTQAHQLSSHLLTPDETREVQRSLLRLKRRLGSLGLAHNIDAALRRYRIGAAVWERFPCYIGWVHARVRHDGTVRPCTSFDVPLGNVNESSLPEIWNSEGFRDFRRRTRTRAGLAEIAASHDCSYCCHALDNLRVHRAFRPLSVL